MAVSGNLSDETNVGVNPLQDSQTENYFGFTTRSSHSDMKLIVDDVPLYVKRILLEMAYPVLKRIFDEQLQDEDNNEVTLDDEDAEGFAEFLACFYPSCEHTIDMNNVFRILPFVYKYEVERLMKESETLLTNSLPETSSLKCIIKYLSVARQQSMYSVLKLLVDIYKRSIQRAVETITHEAHIQQAIFSDVKPFLRTEASKYRFLSAGPNGRERYMDLDDFQDAKYSTAQYEGSHPEVFEDKPIKILTLTLWNINLDISVVNGYEYRFLFTCNAGVNFMVAVKIVYKNNTSEAQEICVQNSGQTPLRLLICDTDTTTVYQMNGRYTIRFHVLMTKPTQ